MGCCNSGLDRKKLEGSSLLQKYDVTKEIDQGAYGFVYACSDRQSCQEYAVKFIDKNEKPAVDGKTTTAAQIDGTREAEMLQAFAHKTIVGFVDYFDETQLFCIVMDKYAGSLSHGIRWYDDNNAKGTFDSNEIDHMAAQMSASIEYLHSKYIIHRGVKFSNFLISQLKFVDPKTKVVLGGFGAAKQLKNSKERVTDKVGNKTLFAPEMLAGNYSYKADMWAFGITIFGLLTGADPYFNVTEFEHSKCMERIDTCGAAPQVKGYVKKMLEWKEEDRMASTEATLHPWVSQWNLDQGGEFVKTKSLAFADALKIGKKSDDDGMEIVKTKSEVAKNSGDEVATAVKKGRNDALDSLQSAHAAKSK